MLGALVECATVTDSALIFTEFLSISCAAALYALLRLWLFLHAFQYWTHLRCPKQKRMNSCRNGSLHRISLESMVRL